MVCVCLYVCWWTYDCVRMSMYVGLQVPMCTCLWTYAYAWVPTYTWIFMYACVPMYVCTCVYAHACIHVHVYMRMHACMCILWLCRYAGACTPMPTMPMCVCCISVLYMQANVCMAYMCRPVCGCLRMYADVSRPMSACLRSYADVFEPIEVWLPTCVRMSDCICIQSMHTCACMPTYVHADVVCGDASMPTYACLCVRIRVCVAMCVCL